jgi:hypothetical protein
MEFVNFPIVALGASLVCLIGVTLYAITQRGALRSRDEQLVVARAQAYAMLELSQAGVLFLDREHRLMGEASAAAPELLGHTCGAGTAFVQVIAELVDVTVRRETVAFLETMWHAEASAHVDATQNPLARVHSGSRHLALRFARLVVDGRVHHIIVSIERIAAPRVMPHTIEVPALNEDTFAKRLAGETGTRPALKIEPTPVVSTEMAPPEQSVAAPAPAPAATATPAPTPDELPPMLTGEFELGPHDVTADSVPSLPHLGNPAMATLAALTQIKLDAAAANSEQGQKPATLTDSLPTNAPAADVPTMTLRRLDEANLATTITSPDVVKEAASPSAPQPDPASIIDPPDVRLNEVLKEIMSVEASRLDQFLAEAREKAGQLRAIIKLPAREPQAFREKLVLILELIRGINARAQRLPLPSVCERAERFEAALSGLRDKQTLSGNDFLPLAVKLDDLLSHLAIQGEVISRLREWRVQNGLTSSASFDVTQRSGYRHGHHHSPAATARPGRFVEHRFAARHRHAKNRAPFGSVFGKSRGDGRVPRRHVRQARLAGRRRARRRAARISSRCRKNSGPAHPQRDSPRSRSALRSRGSGQAGNRYGGCAVRASGSRRLPAQRPGRRPRTRPRQDPCRSRAPWRADGERSRHHGSTQARRPHLPSGFHHGQ